MKWIGYLCLLVFAGHVVATDPVPLRREIVTSERLAAELAKANRGTLMRLTRAEFEERVRRATTGVEQLARPPLLLRAEYAARYDDGQLIGTAKWTIRHESTIPGRLNIEPISAALRSAQWSDGTDVVIGPLSDDNSKWELLVEGPGVRTLDFAWSLRTQSEADGIHFNMQWPAAGIATCAWNLPTSRVPVIANQSGQLISVQPDKDDRTIWTFAVSGSERLDLILPTQPVDRPIWVIKQRQEFTIAPQRVESEIQLEVTATPGRASVLELQTESGFLVSDITATGLRQWQAGEGSRYQLTFREPVAAATINVRGVMLVPDGQPWTRPAITVVGGVSAGEKVTIHVPPDVGFEDVRFGSLRLVNSQFRPNGQQTLSLESGWAFRADAGRLTARVRSLGGAVDVAEERRWEINPERQALSCRLNVRPQHEPLAQWSIVLPAFWDVDSVDCKSHESLRWLVRRGPNDRSTLMLEFDRPPPAGSTVALNIEYRGRAPEMLGSTLPFPDPEPAKVRSRWVQMSVRASPLYDVDARPGPFAVVENESVGPRPDTGDDIAYRFPMGRVEGELAFRPRPARFAASGTGRLRVRHDDVVNEYRLVIRPERGALASVHVTTPPPAQGFGEWRASAGGTIRRVQRLDAIGHLAACLSSQCMVWDSLTGLASMAQGGATWQIVFDKPTAQPITLDYIEVLHRQPEWEQVVGRALLQLGGLPWVNEVFSGLIPPAQNPLVAPALWSMTGTTTQDHTWRYHDPSNRTRPPAEWRSVGGVPTLLYFGSAPSTMIDLTPRAARRLTVSEARVTASLTGDDRVVVRYQAAVRGAGGSRVPMELPPGAQLLDARAAGHGISGIHLNGQRLEFDLPADVSTLPVEITYTLPGLGDWPVGQLNAAAPRWAGDVGAILWSWQLPPGWQACGTNRSEVPNKNNDSTLESFDAELHVFPGDGPTLWVTQPIAFRRACWVIWALVLALLIAWQPRWRVAVFLLLTLLLAWFVLPRPLTPLVFGPIIAVGLMMVWQRWKTLEWRRQAATGTMVMTAWCLSVFSADPTTWIVFIVPAKGDDPETVFAPAELLAKLDALAQGSRTRTASVIQSAKYETSITATQVQTRAHWVVTSFRKGDLFVVPLKGCELVELQVDDQPTVPNVQGGALHVSLPSTGRVTVTARLMANVTARFGVSAINCAIPPSFQSQWTIDCADDLQLNPVAKAVGAISREGQCCTIDLGRAKTLECSWQASTPVVPPTSIQEAYVWDLQRPAARLVGLLRCSKPSSVNNEWHVDVPPELVAARVSTVAPDQLTNWRREEKTTGSSLVIQMAGSTDPLTAIVELVPRQPLNTALPLPFPACHGVSETFVAWRGGPETRPGSVRGFVAVSEETFRRDWLAAMQLHDAALPVRAWRKSLTANEPFVRVALSPQVMWKGDLALVWQLGPKRAEVTGKLSLNCDNGTLPLIECEVPANVTVGHVIGPDVALWSRSGTRLQVWLSEPRTSTNIELRGTANRTDEGTRFDVPVIRWLNAAPTTRLSLVPRPGWNIVPVTMQQLTMQSASDDRGQHFVVERNNYRLIVQPQPMHRTADYRVNTTVSLAEGQPTALTTLEARGTSGPPGSLLMTMSVTPGDEVTLSAPDLKVIEQPALPGRRIWLVEPVRTSTNKWYVQFHATSHARSRTWSVPRIAMDFSGQTPAHNEQLIQVGPGLQPLDVSGMDNTGTDRWQAHGTDWHMEVEAARTRPPRR